MEDKLVFSSNKKLVFQKKEKKRPEISKNEFSHCKTENLLRNSSLDVGSTSRLSLNISIASDSGYLLLGIYPKEVYFQKLATRLDSIFQNIEKWIRCPSKACFLLMDA